MTKNIFDRGEPPLFEGTTFFALALMTDPQEIIETYSRVPNKHVGTFINFEGKFQPTWPYQSLHVY